MKNLIKDLVKVANKCDEFGHHKEADELDELINSIASNHGFTPIGEPVKRSGKVYQQFKDERDNSVKEYEVHPETGAIIEAEAEVPPAPSPLEHPLEWAKYHWEGPGKPKGTKDYFGIE